MHYDASRIENTLIHDILENWNKSYGIYFPINV